MDRPFSPLVRMGRKIVPPVPPAVTCPQCTELMVPGHVRIERTWLGELFGGWSALALYFKARLGKKVPVLPAKTTQEAFRCPGCGAVFLPSVPKSRLELLGLRV